MYEAAMSAMLVSPVVSKPVSAPKPLPPVAAPPKPVQRWLVGPWFDLLFLANLAWPIVVVLYLLRPAVEGTLDLLSFFQVYFLSTPHRWITLVLVFCDSERFWKEPAKFGGLGLSLVGAGVAIVSLGTWIELPVDSLVLLMMIDYVWNAWHFAAQHAGISRIYGRITRPDQSLPHAEFEKTAIRMLVLWVFVRFAVHMATQSRYGANVSWLTPWLAWIDPLAFIPIGIFLYRELAAFQPRCLARLCYIASVTAIYSAQLIAIRCESITWMMAFFFAGAIFHAVEYLAICNWAVQKRSTGIWHYQVTRTGLALIVFMAMIGAANYFVNAQSVYAWTLLTLLVSLLHYAYDGIIWRAKRSS
jgi:hypothetical protein